jgi:LemA protein
MSAGQAWMLGLAVVLLFWAVGAYNRLKRLRNDIQSAFASLDTQLRRRHELAPRLQGALRPQLPAAHDVLERLVAASNQVIAATDLIKGHPHQSGPVHSCNMAEDVFQEAHARLLALLAQPEATALLPELSAQLNELELADNQARFSRSLFNEACQAYNLAARQWPTQWVARFMGFGRAAELKLYPRPSDVAKPSA